MLLVARPAFRTIGRSQLLPVYRPTIKRGKDAPMAMSHQYLEQAQSFFEASKHLLDPDLTGTFAMVAVRGDGGLLLLRAGVDLAAQISSCYRPVFTSKRLIAAQYSLQDLALPAERLMESILTGRITTPLGDVEVPTPPEPSSFRLHHIKADHAAYPGAIDYDQLMVFGDAWPNDIQSENWAAETQKAKPPFDSLNALMDAYSVPNHVGGHAIVFKSGPVAKIEQLPSERENELNLKVVLREDLLTRHLRIGYEAYSDNIEVGRDRIEGSTLEWTIADGAKVATLRLNFRRPASARIYLSFGGQMQQTGWFEPFSQARSPARPLTVGQLRRLKSVIGAAPGGIQVAELASAFKSLMWLSGFEVVRLGDATLDSVQCDFRSPAGELVSAAYVVDIESIGQALTSLEDCSAKSSEKGISYQLVCNHPKHEIAEARTTLDDASIRIWGREDLLDLLEKIQNNSGPTVTLRQNLDGSIKAIQLRGD